MGTTKVEFTIDGTEDQFEIDIPNDLFNVIEERAKVEGITTEAMIAKALLFEVEKMIELENDVIA